MNFVKLAFLIFGILAFTLSAQELSPDSFSEEQMKVLEGNEKIIVTGMSAEQISEYRLIMQRFQKERARDQGKPQSTQNVSFEDRLKKRLENASGTEKAVFGIFIKNIIDNLTELKTKHPLAFLGKDDRYIFPFEIRSGTPNINQVSEEQLKEYGNNVAEIKKKYAEIELKTREIHGLKVNISCVNDSECLLLPYGRTLAKGPVGYFTLSRRNINLSIFAEKLVELGKLDTEIQNELRGFNSLEKIITPPVVTCEKNICGLK